ncbi:MAG: S-layer homology domain-containing protein, partial [Anaerovoracaceae bacterium]
MRQRKIIAITLTIAMILSSFSMVFATETETIATQNGFQDTTNHWAESAINKWAGLGVLKGDERGFRPNDPITRAEMATVLDNIMDYQVAAKNTFSDVPADAWYAEAVLKANAAGILQGDGAGKADPTANITREQSAVMLARAFAVTENSGSNTKFNDAGSISSWARNLVFGMESEGYIQGYNGKFNPKNSITRAEVVTIINNAIKAYYDTAGTYTDNVDGLAIIKVRDVTLKGNTIDGNLIIAEGVGEGDVTLDNVTVKGQTVIRGGGENSIHITGNSSIDSIRIEKVNDQVRIVISDGVTVKYVEVAAGEEIIISGQVDTLELAADNVIVHADAAEINNTNVVGQNSTIIVNKDSKINEITAAAPVEISGEGTVSKVNLEKGADNSTITTPKTNINVAEGVTGTTGTGGKVIPAGETATNGNSSSEAAVIGQEPATGGGGSGGGSSSVAVSAISV